ncbi:MAG: hypothetical protein LBL85_06265 [Methanocalculaceae archaeon]|jgi:hypothetical protein|nr:hypothetical protein [Methanocalculaceae archaeon]
MDYETMNDQLESVLSVRPPNMHEGSDYQLEKIFSYLKGKLYDELSCDACEIKDYLQGKDVTSKVKSNIVWGLWLAELFAKGFARKWVVLNSKQMEFGEIKLLVSAACYFENLSQRDAAGESE